MTDNHVPQALHPYFNTLDVISFTGLFCGVNDLLTLSSVSRHIHQIFDSEKVWKPRLIAAQQLCSIPTIPDETNKNDHDTDDTDRDDDDAVMKNNMISLSFSSTSKSSSSFSPPSLSLIGDLCIAYYRDHHNLPASGGIDVADARIMSMKQQPIPISFPATSAASSILLTYSDFLCYHIKIESHSIPFDSREFILGRVRSNHNNNQEQGTKQTEEEEEEEEDEEHEEHDEETEETSATSIRSAWRVILIGHHLSGTATYSDDKEESQQQRQELEEQHTKHQSSKDRYIELFSCSCSIYRNCRILCRPYHYLPSPPLPPRLVSNQLRHRTSIPSLTTLPSLDFPSYPPHRPLPVCKACTEYIQLKPAADAIPWTYPRKQNNICCIIRVNNLEWDLRIQATEGEIYYHRIVIEWIANSAELMFRHPYTLSGVYAINTPVNVPWINPKPPSDMTVYPPLVSHSSHPPHALYHYPGSPYQTPNYSCDVCSRLSSEPVYHCSVCQFDVCPLCLVPNAPEMVDRMV